MVYTLVLTTTSSAIVRIGAQALRFGEDIGVQEAAARQTDSGQPEKFSTIVGISLGENLNSSKDSRVHCGSG